MENLNQTKQAALTVGKQTQGFINCLVSLNYLYNQIYDVMLEMYGESKVDEMMSDNFSGKRNELQKVIEEFMCVSISENIVGDFKEI